ncbi:type 2 isopentenyl-diphosphate Delta-isomerase [Rhodohalobacter mucosus]|uniref:Isopentenyl-diphosphate delta-isomerase n=1 Tax=Rhodohalobacter mucosus TaxID=2079485 RepID=A0A316TX62_9BACT|nr:type 2 isopentenyl-diphosphate Delta-isomerase [Rhodohalobacter mucosus]PWN07202.1 type 2 isopentenyl-diphosphate Delta-isomerase [Rhodohalobacter mucosus]
MSIQQRKKDHVELTAKEDVFYRKTAGFERYDFIHNALPEVNPAEVDLSAELFGHRFSFPLFISSMTGGYTEAGAVNSVIARVCEKMDLPFGVGSQRAMLEDPSQVESFSVVREYAPNAFIAANIGGAQLIGGLDKTKIDLLVGSIKADAIIVHLNPLQELMQPEGDHDFRSIENGIKHLIESSSVPVIVKETGAGISGQVARRLLSIGASCIDVAGAGGTSWAKVENLRKSAKEPKHQFDDWGIPTTECLLKIQPLRSKFRFQLISSGGVRSSFDIAKSLALGADFAATAQPVIKAIVDGGEDAFLELLDQWYSDMRILLTLLGCGTIQELSRRHLIEINR